MAAQFYVCESRVNKCKGVPSRRFGTQRLGFKGRSFEDDFGFLEYNAANDIGAWPCPCPQPWSLTRWVGGAFLSSNCTDSLNIVCALARQIFVWESTQPGVFARVLLSELAEASCEGNYNFLSPRFFTRLVGKKPHVLGIKTFKSVW